MTFNYMPDVVLTEGDITVLHVGSITDSGKVIPIVSKTTPASRDRDLVMIEANVLRHLRKGLDSLAGPWAECIPQIFESFPMNERYVNIVEYFPGFIDCRYLRQLQTPIDDRTFVWMWKRLLGLLEWIHGLGYVHGAILPPHVLFFPDNNLMPGVQDRRIHSVRLVDWCYSCPIGGRPKAWVSKWADFYPPEVLARKGVDARTDLYMAAKLMVYMLNGASLPWPLNRVLSQCLSPEGSNRPASARMALSSFIGDAAQVFGSPRFHKFIVPNL